ncbi:MAG: hypothetical protein H6737_14795 [Alphaproteobacteria bacterium]|nr:hypothetical protein [Alphaproteobacteria bacterium]
MPWTFGAKGETASEAVFSGAFSKSPGGWEGVGTATLGEGVAFEGAFRIVGDGHGVTAVLLEGGARVTSDSGPLLVGDLFEGQLAAQRLCARDCRLVPVPSGTAAMLRKTEPDGVGAWASVPVAQVGAGLVRGEWIAGHLFRGTVVRGPDSVVEGEFRLPRYELHPDASADSIHDRIDALDARLEADPRQRPRLEPERRRLIDELTAHSERVGVQAAAYQADVFGAWRWNAWAPQGTHHGELVRGTAFERVADDRLALQTIAPARLPEGHIYAHGDNTRFPAFVPDGPGLALRPDGTLVERACAAFECREGRVVPAAEAMALADRSIRAGDRMTLYTVLRALQAQSPGDAMVERNLATVEVQLFLPDPAIARLTALLVKSPDDATSHAVLGEAKLAKEDVAGACESLRRAASLGYAEAGSRAQQVCP